MQLSHGVRTLGLIAALVCGRVTATAQTPAPRAAIQAAADRIARFDKTHDVAELESAETLLVQSAQFTNSASENVIRRRQCLQGWLAVFRAIDTNIDPTLNLQDLRQLPAISLAPPREKSGRQLFSGADPRDVQDPVARATYEAELLDNERKTKRVNFQASLHNLDRSTMSSLRAALINFRPYTPGDTPALMQIIRGSGMSSRRRAQITSLI